MADLDVAVGSAVSFRRGGEVSSRVVRFVPGFVVQIELPTGFKAAAADTLSGQQRELALGRSYNRGDVVLCVAADDPIPETPQIAVFLADTNDSRPAHPVVGTARSWEQVSALVDRLTEATTDTGNEVLKEPTPVQLTLA
jgi:hypothetical protein